LASQGKVAQVPVMLGTNENEGNNLSGLPPDLTNFELQAWINITFGSIYNTQLNELYPDANFSIPFYKGATMFGDYSMSCPARQTARWLSRTQPVYLYQFTHILQAINKINPYLEVCHASELILVFNVPGPIYFLGFNGISLTPQELLLADTFGKYWINFATNYTPNSADTFYWPAYTQSSDINIALDFTLSTNIGLKSAACDFWAYYTYVM